jgi:DNA-binding NtrC family response regulator
VDLNRIFILVFDPDTASSQSVCYALKGAGYQVSVALSEGDALALCEQKLYNVVFIGFDPGQLHVALFMEKVHAVSPDSQFILMSSGGNIRMAVESIKRGAFDFLPKPIDEPRLQESVRKALEHQIVIAEDPSVRARLRHTLSPNIFVGHSREMEKISQLIGEIAPTDVSVLIQGDSGTGKEIIARSIHERGRRQNGPFIAVNCAALTDSIIESEFFGHVRGAFTGAVTDRAGRFQLASNGVLFLDEIGDLSPKGQGDLLRVLDDGYFRPVGSPKLVKSNVRLIAATNKDLEEACAAGRFREDLFYRINVVTIYIPPLRERSEDIPQLIESISHHFCAKHRRHTKRFSPEAIKLMQSLPWPGNVRQLRNIIEHLVVTVPHTVIKPENLPAKLLKTASRDSGFFLKPGMKWSQVESELIRQTLLHVTSNRSEAADILGISRRSLHYKIKQYGLQDL